MTDIEKMDLRSMDIVEEKREKLRELFPEVFTEGQKIDFERLKLTLGEAVDVGKERYGVNWPGKSDCFKIIQQPSIATLTPAREESVNFDETENLFIEGDNLEVLKLLQKSYLGKIKMISIDPPYNTGNDFIYPDNYAESLDTYLRYTGQIDDEGRKYSTNTEADGRFHSKWLNMMYPRLFLARNLLREDGVIFIHIDDNEVSNLRKVCDEIFGEENFVANVIWQKKYSPQNDAKYFSDSHEHILLFAKNKDLYAVGLLPRTEEANDRYKNPDNDPRGPWKSSDLTRQEYRTNDDYAIVSPLTGQSFRPPKGNSWGRPKANIEALISDNRIWFGPEGRSTPSLKRFLSEVKQGITPQTIWERKDVGDTQEGKKIIIDIFGNATIFETPKPPRLIMRQCVTANFSQNDIILDFFSGSATTAHALLDLNKQDKGNRKFILVQLPEPCAPDSEAFKAGYKTIADIGKERIRSVIKRIQEEQEQKKDLFSGGKTKLDLGFKVFKLEPSNFKLWNDQVAKDKDAIKNQLEMFVEHINPKSSQEDILYELLLKSGFPLTTKIEPLTLADKTVFSIDEGAMLICLEKDLTPEVIKAMAEKKPVRVVCLDEGFHGNDQLKTNAVQIMKSREITFRTV
jgi:adenine-specific DNA-methyltransferase